METAYDLKELGKRLKEKGLVQAEDLAGDVYVVVKQFLRDSALLSKTPYDNIAVPFLDNLDALVLPQIDKIDGVPG